MVAFLIALIVAVLGVGAYAHYNPGVQDVTLRTYHFTAVPDWMPVAASAGVILFLFLVHAVYASLRIRALRRANEPGRQASSSRSLQSSNR
jgi:hypothetical protein